MCQRKCERHQANNGFGNSSFTHADITLDCRGGLKLLEKLIAVNKNLNRGELVSEFSKKNFGNERMKSISAQSVFQGCLL